MVAVPETRGGGQPAGFRVARPRDGVSVIEVHCELDALTEPAFTQLLFQALEDNCRGLIVDMSGCEFLGSSGLAALVAGEQLADQASIPIKLAGLTRVAARALAAAGLEPVFQVYPTASDAAAALNG